MWRSAISIRHLAMRQTQTQHGACDEARTQYSVLSARQSLGIVPCAAWRLLLLVAFITLELFEPTVVSAADPIRPPSNVKVEEIPYRGGTSIKVSWDLSPDDTTDGDSRVEAYEIRFDQVPKPFSQIESLAFRFLPGWIWNRVWRGRGSSFVMRLQTLPGARSIEPSKYYDGSSFDGTGVDSGSTFRVSVVSIGTDKARSAYSNAVTFPRFRTSPQTAPIDKSWFALVVILVCGTVIVCTELARRGKPFYVRPIAGLQAIEEAVGRATEMGKPMLFVPGIQDMNEIDTVAGLTILSSVAKTAAEYDTPIEVPTTRSLVMTAAREAVQAAALAAGRPDYYNEDRIYYVTDEQFGYVAHTCGWMYREQPAACFYLGKFYAESLILAETGNAVGAIQIAGTAETTQLPFFVAACDYTLIGEELFAASAYLSGEPAQLGMLKGQDFGKLAAMVLVVIGCLLATWDSILPRGKDAQGKDLPPRTQFLRDEVLKGG